MLQIETIDYVDVIETETKPQSGTSFLEANTVAVNFNEIKMSHHIPVFVKDNEPVISQKEFIEAMIEIAANVYSDETISSPIVRVSHPIKGRIPDAKD